MNPKSCLSLMAALLAMATPLSAAAAPQVKDGDVTLRNFTFATGESLPDLRMHYRTLGTPKRDASGRITNSVMILHGTGGSGAQFLAPQFADELYGPGQPLDVTQYFIILPDNIGHGASSKPSDGLRMAFPKYDYADMVEAQRQMLKTAFGIERLRLIFGTSMGCMHIFVWAEAHPDFADALMPMACQPVEIAGRNRMWRVVAMDAIRADPAWQGGNYTTPPVQGLRTAAALSVMAGSAPEYFQAQYPTRAAAEANVRERIAKDIASRDANDFLYQFDSSRTYNPLPGLEKITAPTMWINSADDFINPPELKIPETVLPRLKTVTYRLIPSSPDTRGHGTHTWAKFWKADLVRLLRESERK
ncbi:MULTISPECIES: alpha/beta fold hydrolase [Asticcacaulis]|uniref:alpha/beta fold hydrolase n=1 Tax=Asticcacaulis TaxID=76890 RepID=UPI001AE98BB2|nr:MULTISPECIES: alpha/beta fold hydrolase [Asticcacaulis]MBP2159331.1 homoserine O-acetyltransferase [Asticcacaulis solisilvae]MDR6800376.1 homoserine O-acetyltransferase [Asticcacaulis sp. BE141]